MRPYPPKLKELIEGNKDFLSKELEQGDVLVARWLEDGPTRRELAMIEQTLAKQGSPTQDKGEK